MHYSSTLTTYLSTARWTFSTCFMCLPSENWRRPQGRPRTTCMKTIQQDLKSNNLSLNEVLIMAQNHPLWRLMSMFGAAYC